MSSSLRERKKRQTRQRIADVAVDLFALRGFEQVTVAEIAESAEVAPATVFNYFKTKEELIFHGTSDYEEAMVTAIRSRPSGTGVVESYRTFLLRAQGALSSLEPDGLSRVATMSRIIEESPTLRGRERADADRFTQRLAELIAEESGASSNDLGPWVVANALVGVNRAMTRTVRRGALAGKRPATVAKRVIAEGTRAFEALQISLSGQAPSSVAHRPEKKMERT